MFVNLIAVDSAEIQILNPWVKIPDDWNSGSYSDESSTSSESTYSMSSAQAQYYSSSYGGSDGTEPFFDHAMMTNLSEHLGNHAFLRCRVKKLGDGTVRKKIYFYHFPFYTFSSNLPPHNLTCKSIQLICIIICCISILKLHQ